MERIPLEALEAGDLRQAWAIQLAYGAHQDGRVDRFAYETGPPLTVPGLAEPFATYELKTETEQIYRRRVGTPGELFSELVGREDEMTA